MRPFSPPSRFRSALVALPILGVLTTLLTSCGEEPGPSEPRAPSEADLQAFLPSPPTRFRSPYERALDQLAERVPGFGGLYGDEEGNLYVYVLERQKRAEAESGLRPFLQEFGEESRTLTFLQADFDWKQLRGWYSLLRGPAISVPGVQSTDLDEAKNRLRVEVLDSNAEGLLSDLVADLGIPAEAVIIERRDPILPLATLRDRLRPLEGGNKIAMPFGSCTMGFNAGWLDPFFRIRRSFLTNSHCTNSAFRPGDGVTGTKFYQNTFTTSNLVGTEIADHFLFTGGDCPSGRQCRWSDAAVIEHANLDSTFDIGKIHRTTLRAQCNGSITIATSPPVFTIISENVPSSFALVNKMGQTTGWTGKGFDSRCQDINVLTGSGSDSGVTLLCQDVVKAGAGPGDSGSPVFVRRSSTSNEVHLSGILWGGSTTDCRFGFSPLANVELEFGNLITR